MSVKSAPFYWLECDSCGTRADYDDFVALSTQAEAIDMAYGADWSIQGERHHCPGCPVIADCKNCGKDAGKVPLERDGLCQSCWDAAEAKDAAQ